MTVIPPKPVSAQPVSAARSAGATKPGKLVATQSLHGDFLEQSIPSWLTDASPQRRKAFKDIPTALPSWYLDATPVQRKALSDSFKASLIAQNRLDKSMATFKEVEAFAKPLLIKALKDQYQVQVDVEKTLLCLRRPVQMGILDIELSSFEFLKLSMLDAALHNFEAWECEKNAYHDTSGFVVATTTPDTYESTRVNLTVSQFMTLCRSLDIGKQYQSYLQAYFHPADAVAEKVFREQFIASQKATMRAAAEQALLHKDIKPEHYTMILSVINGEMHPWIGKKQVWFRDLGLMKKRLTGCVVFVISEKYRYSDEWIIYIPHDSEHPFKCYSGSQDRDEFKRLLTARDASAASSAEPTAYQRFLSQFLPYDQRPYYFSQFTQKDPDAPSDPWGIWRSPWQSFVDVVNPGSVFTRIKELPPERKTKMAPAPDPYIAPSVVLRKGRGIWAANEDLWEYLYKQNSAKVLADARSHAVPTDEVDTKAREAKLAHLLQVGLLGLNMVSMFVPVLGEVMMVVMAGQLLYETLEGAIEWSEGDRRAAKDHLIDVAENLAQIAVMAGVGAGVRKFSAAKPVPAIETLSPVQLPNGDTRLWKPDLSTYESSVTLSTGPGPNASGQHVIDGKTYIRQGSKVYQQFYDDSIGKWRIKHPTDAQAYQPVLDSNGRGAWRHTLERPLEWDRLTLLRRMGHEADALSDAELIKAADISGVSDNALRKMHLDHALPPPELSQAMRLLQADADSTRVIEQLRGTQAIDEMYLYALPLVTEMPRWPANRVLEVFDGAQLSGKSVKYGSERRVRGVGAKASIQVARPDVLSGNLPTHILAGLDEAEITRLLGAEGARVRDARAEEFGKQLADYAQTRQPAIFDSIYKGSELTDSRVTLLQNTCPGLSEAAAQEVLANAHPDDLDRLGSTRRVSLRMLEEARWYARQSREVQAFAGLRSENIASADSRRLALHTLESLPGWPDSVRLEVRDGNARGALLDSIGSETADEKKYLIKKGPLFQAFNDRGEALNSLPASGDNFYASIMHALPDEARRSLGVPEVSQWAELQRKIVAHAERHRSTALALLQPKIQWPKPPVRMSDTLMGYPASGRGAGINSNLTVQVRDVYPELTDQQANGFILKQLREGKDNRDIFNLLQARRQEWAQLNSTLEEWVGTSTAAPWERSAERREIEQKMRTAQALKASWRKAPLAGEVLGADQLSIVSHARLPMLMADFSHVRELSIGGSGMTDADAGFFLVRFPNVEELSLGQRSGFSGTYMVYEQHLTTLPLEVARMSSLKRLKFRTTASEMDIGFLFRLQALTSLEELHLDFAGFRAVYPQLDLAALTQLTKLKIEGPGLSQWPAHVESLPKLERLDLSKTSIASIPPALYFGHDKLWVGLSLDWSKFSRAAFEPAYQHVKNYKGALGHLGDLDSMVRRYGVGELDFLMGEAGHINLLPERLLGEWETPETRLRAVDILRVEHTGIFRQFYDPPTTDGLRTATRTARWTREPNARVVRALEENWRASIRKRYRQDTNVQQLVPAQWNPRIDREELTVFELKDTSWTQGTPAISELPQLPAETFSHVRTVRLDRLAVPAEQIRGFLKAFSGAHTLEITASGLTEVPITPGALPQLTRLDLSLNRIVVTPQVQAQINGLPTLEYFNARLNQLATLDVTALTNLKALNLSSSGMKEWPTGAEKLPHLKWLDLRYNNITRLPEQVLAHDDALLKTSLKQGNTFGPEGEPALQAAQQRIEVSRGLPEGTLQRFDQEPVPMQFPPVETALSLVEHLLPLPRWITQVEGAEGFASRLQDLNPIISQDQALACVARLRKGGMTDVQIDARLSEWQQSAESLTRQLNGWIFNRETEINGNLVSAQGREFAALKIRECWQDGLTGHTEGAGQTLDLTGLHTGDLPPLSTVFDHVRTLTLTGTGLTVQSFNEFCRAFPELTTLGLNGNDLEVLPDAVSGLSRLERLELSGNRFADAQSLYNLAGANRLRWLDLSHNRLDQFNAGAFTRLETLNLANNGLYYWPDGVLDLENLRTLNLNDNNIATFPERLLRGDHEGLVAGTDLSENQLTLTGLEHLRDRSAANADRDVMGFSRRFLDREIAERLLETDSESNPDVDSDGGSDSDSDGDGGGGGTRRVDEHAGVEDVEVIHDPAHDVAAPAMETWLTYTPADVRAARQTLWLQLAQEENHESFFHLLSTLRNTDEYRLSGGDLTHRVWRVIHAATENTELRQLLFLNAETHGTCGDGRILSFSELETRVYEYTALREIPRHRPDQQGRALLDLSRRLFRLERVDRLAEDAGRNKDRAEIRLQYRIGMIRGWPDGLELPGQPEHMMFGTPIRGQRLIDARAAVLRDEASNMFVEDLIARDYWVRYLKDRYADAFNELEINATRRQEEVEDAHPDKEGSAEALRRYLDAMRDLQIELADARTDKLKALSRTEIQKLATVVDDAPRPGPSSPQPGPSHRT